MSLIKLTLSTTNLRIDVAAAHVVSVSEQPNTKTRIALSTGEVIEVNESGRSVRGYVKKALAGFTKANEATDSE